MGLDIGIITIQYLPRPRGVAYKFAQEMAEEASATGYMSGADNNWAAFTQRQVLRMLERFAQRQGLDASAKAEVIAWLRSLPWDGWQDNLAISADLSDDDEDEDEDEESEDGGLIELHFNW